MVKSGTGWLRHRRLEGALVVVGLLWGLFTPASSGGANPVMRVLAVVNDTVLTSKDLADFMALQKLAPGTGAIPRAEPGESLAQLIDQVLILQEARRRQIVEITRAEVDSEIGRRMALLGGAEIWEQRVQSLEVSEEVIRTLVHRQLLALKYMDLRLRLFIRVTEGEIEEYYKDHRGELGETLREELKGQIEQLLAARKFNARLQEFTRELRDKARILIPSEDLKLVGGDEMPAPELLPDSRVQSKERGAGETK